MQHPQPFTPTSQSRKAARWEEQLRECLCISQRRAATPLENILEQKQQAWSLRVGISTQTTWSSCWGHRKAVWPCLDPPGSAQSPLPFCSHTAVQWDRWGTSSKTQPETICKNSTHCLKAGRERRRKRSLSFFSSVLCMLTLFKYSSLQNPSVFHSLRWAWLWWVQPLSTSQPGTPTSLLTVPFGLCLFSHSFWQGQYFHFNTSQQLRTHKFKFFHCHTVPVWSQPTHFLACDPIPHLQREGVFPTMGTQGIPLQHGFRRININEAFEEISLARACKTWEVEVSLINVVLNR